MPTRSWPADYVSAEDGTGLVHIAPAFGEDDKVVTDAAGIDVVNPVDAQGRFTSLVPPYEGYQVFDANLPIIATSRPPACCCVGSPTSTPTRTAGVARPR